MTHQRAKPPGQQRSYGVVVGTIRYYTGSIASNNAMVFDDFRSSLLVAEH